MTNFKNSFYKLLSETGMERREKKERRIESNFSNANFAFYVSIAIDLFGLKMYALINSTWLTNTSTRNVRKSLKFHETNILFFIVACLYT